MAKSIQDAQKAADNLKESLDKLEAFPEKVMEKAMKKRFSASENRLSKMETMHNITQGKVSEYFMTVPETTRFKSQAAEIKVAKRECDRSIQKLKEFSSQYKKLEEKAQEESGSKRSQYNREMKEILSSMEAEGQQAIKCLEKETELRFEQCMSKVWTKCLNDCRDHPGRYEISFSRLETVFDNPNPEPNHPKELFMDLVIKSERSAKVL